MVHLIEGDFAAQAGDLPLKAAQACFTGIFLNDPDHRRSGEVDFAVLEAVGFNFPGDQMDENNPALLLFGVAGQFDHLQTVDKRLRNGIHGVGRGDERHLGQVKGQIQIVVHEVGVLLRIKHFQQRCRRTPLNSWLILSSSSSMNTGLLVSERRIS